MTSALLWSALFPTEASIRKSAGTTVASADGPLFGDVLELLKSRILLAAAVTEAMEAGGGGPKPLKRLVEVGSLSVISLPGSTTTRGGVTPAGLGAAAGLTTLRSGQTLPYLASCSEAAGSESR